MSQTAPQAEQVYLSAAQAFQAGRSAEALVLLQPLLERGFPDGRIHGLAGFIHLREGRHAPAAEALAVARRHSPAEAVFALAHADALLFLGKGAEAEAAYRTALALEPQRSPAVIGLGRALLMLDRPLEALSLYEQRVEAGDPDHAVLVALAELQTQFGRAEPALETWKLAARTYPNSAAAFHNLAAAYGDLYRFQPSLDAADQALKLGAKGPQTWLVRARALQGLDRMEEAEAAFRQVVHIAPHSAEAQRDLSQFLWMRTGDLKAASASLEEAVRKMPQNAELVAALAKVHQFGGDLTGARKVLSEAIQRSPTRDANLHAMAADLALEDDKPAQALQLARWGAELAPGQHRATITLIDALLGAGQPEEAARLGEALVTQDPDDVLALARLATAWRMLGDPRYKEIYNYDLYVRPYQIEPPKGWNHLSDYLSDLSAALVNVHAFVTHPFDQSLRNGSQTSANLELSDDPAIKAFFSAIDAPIRQHMEHLHRNAPQGLGRRYTGDYFLSGVWSVFLRPKGFHVDHIHPMGWLSSAFYVEMPTAPPEDPRQGWIKFGEPGTKTQPKLEAEHYVQPKPGTLCLFPSHMWHGTVPFTSTERRLTVAFDIRPKDVLR
jgi:uncharacterized protein (TIGR02466 family)